MKPALLFACLSLFAAAARGQLVINEVDYDQPGTDSAEFIELLNTGPGTISKKQWHAISEPSYKRDWLMASMSGFKDMARTEQHALQEGLDRIGHASALPLRQSLLLGAPGGAGLLIAQAKCSQGDGDPVLAVLGDDVGTVLAIATTIVSGISPSAARKSVEAAVWRK